MQRHYADRGRAVDLGYDIAQISADDPRIGTLPAKVARQQIASNGGWRLHWPHPQGREAGRPAGPTVTKVESA